MINMEPTVQNTGGSPAVEGELTAIPILALEEQNNRNGSEG
jgi:hypothetical protein